MNRWRGTLDWAHDAKIARQATDVERLVRGPGRARVIGFTDADAARTGSLDRSPDLRLIEESGGFGSDAAGHPSGDFVLLGGPKGLAVFGSDDLGFVTRLPLEGDIDRVAFLSDGRRFLVARDFALELWELVR